MIFQSKRLSQMQEIIQVESRRLPTRSESMTLELNIIGDLVLQEMKMISTRSQMHEQLDIRPNKKPIIASKMVRIRFIFYSRTCYKQHPCGGLLIKVVFNQPYI